MFAVLILFAAMGLLLYVIATQVSSLMTDWPQFREQLHNSLEALHDWIRSTFHITKHKQLVIVQDATNKVVPSGSTVVGVTLLSLSSVLLFLVFTFGYTFFFLLYRRIIMCFMESVFMDENKKLVHEIIERVQHMIRKYIIGLLTEMAIVATVVSLAFLTLGIKYAILLGLITALLNIIPYVGMLTALVISSAVTLATAPEYDRVIYVMITLFVTHLVDANILLPLIVGSRVRINALVTLLGVVVGEMVWGLPGMFLSVPVIAVLKIIFDRVEGLKSWGILLGDEEPSQNRLVKKLKFKRNLAGGE